MIKHKLLPVLLCMGMLLTGSVNCLSARADHRVDRDHPIKLYATAETGPIGTVEALNMIINGKRTDGAQVIWNGDVLAPASTSVRVPLDGVGVITLARGALARLASAPRTRGDNTTGRCLIASLISGEMRVRLASQASAHIEASGATITASEGASFLVSNHAGQAVLDTIKGAARIIEPRAQTDITVASRAGNLSAVLANSNNLFEFIVTQNGQPLANRRVVFALIGAVGSFPAGTATFVGVTNLQGIVSVPFTAASSPATGSLRVMVDGAKEPTDFRIEVKKKPSSTTRNIVIGAIAGVVIGGSIIVVRARSIEQEPPPTIVP